MGTLEERVINLEHQLSTILCHLGTTEGTLLASYSQVKALEETVQAQQRTIESLEATQSFFQTQFPDYLDKQLQQVMQQRGSKGLDYVNLTKFMATNLAQAIATLNNHCTSLGQKLPHSSTIQPVTQPSPEDTYIALELRVKQLETQGPSIVSTQSYQTQPNQETAEELSKLKDHMYHLETSLLEEVQRAYRTVYKPGEYAAPLMKLQTMIDLLNKEFQSFRGFNVKQYVETTLAASHQSFKEDIEARLATRASYDQLQKFEATVDRVESFSKDVQTGMYAIKQKYAAYEQSIETKFTNFSSNIRETFHVKELEKRYNSFEDRLSVYKQTYSTLEASRKTLEVTFTNFEDAQRKSLLTISDTITSLETSIQTHVKQIEFTNLSVKTHTDLQKKYNTMVHSIQTTFLTLQDSVPEKVRELQTYIRKIIRDTINTVEEEQSIQKVELEKKYNTIVHSIQTTFLTLQDSVPEKVRELQTYIRKIIRDTLNTVEEEQSIQKVELETKQALLTKLIQSSFTTMESSIPSRIQQIQKFIQTSMETKFKELDTVLATYMKERDIQVKTFNDTYTINYTNLDTLGTKYKELHTNLIQYMKLRDTYTKSFEDDCITYSRNVEVRLEALLQDKIQYAQQKLESLVQGYKQGSIHQANRIYTSLTKCFYTALFGTPGQQLDTLGSFERIPGWDYICFTNQPIKDQEGWTIVQVPYTGKSPALEAKRYKWLSHTFLEEYDVVVWMDAYFAPNPSRSDLLKTWILGMKEKGTTILHKAHGERTCVWDECNAVVQSKRDTESRVKQVKTYLKSIQMPNKWGLFDTSILIKFHKHSELQTLCESIYSQLTTTSYRDQLAVTPVYYTTGFRQYGVQALLNGFEKVGTHIQTPVES